MTSIACRDGIMAADSSVWFDDLSISSTDEKIKRLADGSLFAASGRLSLVSAFERWMAAGADENARPDLGEDKEDDFSALWLRSDGIWHINRDLRPYPANVPFAAEGSHVRFMLGAMAQGASAERAVALAIEHGAYARGPVVVRRLGE